MYSLQKECRLAEMPALKKILVDKKLPTAAGLLS